MNDKEIREENEISFICNSCKGIAKQLDKGNINKRYILYVESINRQYKEAVRCPFCGGTMIKEESNA